MTSYESHGNLKVHGIKVIILKYYTNLYCINLNVKIGWNSWSSYILEHLFN